MRKRIKMIGASKGITFTQEDLSVHNLEIGDVIDLVITHVENYNRPYINKEDLLDD